ncbi:putative DNA primase large subunit, eukaryotic/archaeal [Medicago truncatula]|uniref:DNA primase large subunit n=1 Tax=Medicago truncatula TaxID=3880 RepID=G7LHA9_MEDTR|nr:probable DNA primase large subunit [Medicago truncatula]AET04972.2 DNA primase large subunit, putative [Medicago truncatula]RHN42504.1 putative DNA primase large subunit, eukaryotic/archaeal [Medicago truncatula]
MEVVRPQSHRNLFSSNDAVSAPTIPLYRSAPPLEVRLEDFESFAIDRLRVLKGISDGLSRGKKPDEMEKLVKDLWKMNMRHQHASEVLNKDIISHFVLRLVYCRTEDLRKWFLSMECALFRYRFRFLTTEAQRAIMDEFDLTCKAVNNVEFESIKEKLGQVARSMGQPSPTVDAIFYKVPFEEVPELVARRQVFISQGYAYVAMNQVVSLVATLFRSQLSKTLVLTNRKWTSSIREQEKHRLTPIVEALSSSYLGPDFSQPREYAEISLKDIDQVAKSSFPLCMRHLFDKLKEDHHLKHGGRMQLGLFLKGVGLNLDDALAFWRAEFSKKVGLEKFEKEYSYNIRHNYGKEGKRTDYTPYSCSKVISSTPGAGDHHGCPYRHFSEENLRAALSRMGVNSRAMEDVMDKVRNRHYQLACTLTFEALHGVQCDAGINHPNQYFSDSQKILQPKKDSAA